MGILASDCESIAHWESLAAAHVLQHLQGNLYLAANACPPQLLVVVPVDPPVAAALRDGAVRCCSVDAAAAVLGKVGDCLQRRGSVASAKSGWLALAV